MRPPVSQWATAKSLGRLSWERVELPSTPQHRCQVVFVVHLRGFLSFLDALDSGKKIEPEGTVPVGDI